jgi:hypothetical protein
VTRIEHLAIDHYILLDKRFFEPDYDLDAGFTFVFAGENMPERVGLHVSKVVDIAVFPEWYPRLAAIGERERLVMPLINFAHPVYQISPDRSAGLLISAAVERVSCPGPAKSRRRLIQPLRSRTAWSHRSRYFRMTSSRLISLGEASSTAWLHLKYEGDWTWLSFDRKPDD